VKSMNQKIESRILQWFAPRTFSDNPLAKWNRKNLKSIFSNLRFRILILILDAALFLFSVYALSVGLTYESKYGLASQLFVLGIYAVFMALPIVYGWRSSMQIAQELTLNASIVDVRADIKHLKKQEDEKFRISLEADMNRTRLFLKNLIDLSSVISPPIYDYELDRVQKGIDIFFNSVSEVLFPIKQPFSNADAQLQRTLDEVFEDEEEEPMEEADWEPVDETDTIELVTIHVVNIHALDEFMAYLGDVLFEETRPFSPFSFRHHINLIKISKFMNSWNRTISRCANCKSAYEKAKKDIDEYYKSRVESKQRFTRLTDDIVVVLVSVFLSVILSKIIP
jgi:hypothetical protein